MSKLYARVNTDTLKNEKTARGQRRVDADVLYNFDGKQSPAGGVYISAVHGDDHISIIIVIEKPDGRGRETIKRIIERGGA
jgi:hypothetical protein